jgi:hypothetical protein
MSVSADKVVKSGTHIHCHPERPDKMKKSVVVQVPRILWNTPTSNAIHFFDAEGQQPRKGA